MAEPIASTPPPAEPISTPSPEPQPSSQPVASAPSTPSVPDAGGAAVPAAPSAPSWLDQFRQDGFDLGTDEVKARQQLTQMYRERQQLTPLVPYVTAYMQHAPQFSKWMQQQQTQAAPASQPSNAEKKWYADMWNPPEFNPAWEKMVVRDQQTGALTTVPGAPPDIAPKYAAYIQYRQEQMENFVKNPYEFIEPAVKKLAREEAVAIVREQFSQHSDLTASKQYVDQHASWLYEKDANGQPITSQQYNPATGQFVQTKVMSQWGQLFTQAVQEESARQQRYGYSNIEEQKRYGEMRVGMALQQAEIQRLQKAQTAPATPAQNPQQASNAAFLAANNPGGQMPTTRGNTMPAGNEKILKQNLQQQMLADLQAAGITGTVGTNVL